MTPGHISTSPRTVKEADALVGAGFEVDVIVGTTHVRWARDADAAFVDRPWRIVCRLPYGPGSPRLRRGVQLLRQRTARAMVAAGMRDHRTVLAAWHPIGPDLVRAALRVPADLYIAHYPAALPAAAIAARAHGARYAFDAEDFHLGDPPEGAGFELQRSMMRIIEGRYLGGCAYVTAASPGIADAYAGAYGIRRPTVVLNVFPREQGPSRATVSGTAEPRPSLYWFSQTIGSDRGLECAVRAIGRARSRPHLYLRGAPAAGFADRLRAIARECGAAERLHLLPPAEPAEMERLAASYDLGFIGETGHTPNRRIALTNKLFSYLLAGLPAVVSDVQAHRTIVGELGSAARLYRVDDADDLAAALDALLLDAGALAAARAEAYRLGQERFNWDLERSRLVACVAAACGLASAPAC